MKKTQREKGYYIYLTNEYTSKEIDVILEFVAKKHESLELYYILNNNYLKGKLILEIYIISDNSNEIYRDIKELFFDSKIFPKRNKFYLKSKFQNSNTPLVRCIKKK
jgi:hypothetical protein